MTFTKFLKLIKRDGTEHYSREQNNANLDIIDKAIEDISSITAQAEGTSLVITDAASDCGLYSLYIEGNSSQNGIPSPDAPIAIDSIGDSGSFDITACDKNLLNPYAYSNPSYYSVRDDNFIVCNNTTAYNAYHTELLNLPMGNYTVCVEVESIEGGNALIYIGKRKDDYSLSVKTTKNVTLENTDTVMIMFDVKSGVTITARIAVYSGNTALPFESYKGNTATITSALPLCSVGDICDELIFNADGTAKVIKRFEKMVLNGSESWQVGTTGNADIRRMIYYPQKASSVKANNTKVNGLCSHYSITTANDTYAEATLTIGIAMSTAHYIAVYDTRFNTADSLSGFKAWLAENPVTFIYELATPEEINLTVEETATLFSLETYEGLTNVFNSDNALMSVKYWVNGDVGSLLTEISRNTNARLTALENAIIGG